MEKYRVEHETGSYCETIDNVDDYTTASAYAQDWIWDDPEHSYSGDTFRIVDNETDEVADEFLVTDVFEMLINQNKRHNHRL